MQHDDFAWLVEHGPELFSQYAGKWIAVRDGKVVGVGDTAPEAAQQTRDSSLDVTPLLYALDAHGDRL